MLPKKIGFFIILIASIFIINNLVRSIYSLWQKDSLVEEARGKVEEEKKRNSELKNKLSQIDNQQYIEKEARNKLFLAKPGEQVIVLPEDVLLKATLSATPTPTDTRPNWRKWWDLFF
jgi:cell division protein FtsB